MHSCLSIATRIEPGLRREFAACGFRLHAVGSPSEGLALLGQFGFEAIVLDADGFGLDSIAVLQQLNARTRVPVLVLSSSAAEPVQLVGFELGAADWVTKPASPRLIGARLRRLVRPAAAAPPEADGALIRRGPLLLAPAERQATLGGQPLALTGGLFDLLRLLAQRAGQVVPRADITLALRGTADAAGRGADMQVCRLRRALHSAGVPGVALASVRRIGYRLVLPV